MTCWIPESTFPDQGNRWWVKRGEAIFPMPAGIAHFITEFSNRIISTWRLSHVISPEQEDGVEWRAGFGK
jgi:hypothetical protein